MLTQKHESTALPLVSLTSTRRITAKTIYRLTHHTYSHTPHPPSLAPTTPTLTRTHHTHPDRHSPTRHPHSHPPDTLTHTPTRTHSGSGVYVDESLLSQTSEQLAAEGAVSATTSDSSHEWTQHWDPDAQAYYYFNTVTQEVTALVLAVAMVILMLVTALMIMLVASGTTGVVIVFWHPDRTVNLPTTRLLPLLCIRQRHSRC